MIIYYSIDIVVFLYPAIHNILHDALINKNDKKARKEKHRHIKKVLNKTDMFICEKANSYLPVKYVKYGL